MTSLDKKLTKNQQKLVFSLTCAVLMALLIFIVYRFNIPNPNMILITALVVFTSVGGWIPGLISAILMEAYSMFFFSENHSFFTYTPLNRTKMIIVTVGVVLTTLSVILLKLRREKAKQAMLDANDQLAKANEQLGDANAQLGDANARLAKTNEQLAEANKQLEEANTQLADRNEILTELVRVKEENENVRTAAERAEQERLTFSRISALFGDLLVMYSVDPKTGHYLEYTASEDYNKLGISREGEDFFTDSLNNLSGMLNTSDWERISAVFSMDSVLRAIQEDGLFSIEYQIPVNRRPTYVRLSAADFVDDHGEQLLIGVTNIDAQIRRDMENERRLSSARKQAMRDGLTGVKNKLAYIEEENKLNEKIDNGEPVEFALAVFDVNDLKTVNDTQGHQAGDDYLKAACTVICRIFKHSPVFRVGGDEFAVIAQGHDYKHMDELLSELDARNREAMTGHGPVIACGMARYNGEEKVDVVFGYADKEMYEKKKALKR